MQGQVQGLAKTLFWMQVKTCSSTLNLVEYLTFVAYYFIYIDSYLPSFSYVYVSCRAWFEELKKKRVAELKAALLKSEDSIGLAFVLSLISC